MRGQILYLANRWTDFPAEQQESKKGRMGEKSFPSKSRVACKIREFLKVCENGHLEL